MVTAEAFWYSVPLCGALRGRRRGLMLRKIVMMRMLMGNMSRPLSTPMITSAQVIFREPEEETQRQEHQVPSQDTLTTDLHLQKRNVIVQ